MVPPVLRELVREKEIVPGVSDHRTEGAISGLGAITVQKAKSPYRMCNHGTEDAMQMRTGNRQMKTGNYQKELDQILASLAGQASGKTPRLLLHSCCAPCSSYVLEYLSPYFEITDFFYNPNITGADEYRYRCNELQRLIGQMPLPNPVTFVEGAYEPGKFFDAVKGLENEREGGARCAVCFELRLREAARLAAEGGYDYFTTSLTISPLKNAAKLNEIGQRLAEEYGVKHLPSDFKKRGGYQRSIELSRKYDLYRQDFCGCVFSERERKQRMAENGTAVEREQRGE